MGNYAAFITFFHADTTLVLIIYFFNENTTNKRKTINLWSKCPRTFACRLLYIIN